MLVLGIILLVVGWLTGIGIISTIGWILAVVGLILMLIGYFGDTSIGGRRYWW